MQINLQHLSYNDFALTTPLSRTRRACPLGGALLPVKGWVATYIKLQYCISWQPKARPTRVAHFLPCRCVNALLSDVWCPQRPTEKRLSLFLPLVTFYSISWNLISLSFTLFKLRKGVCTFKEKCILLLLCIMGLLRLLF